MQRERERYNFNNYEKCKLFLTDEENKEIKARKRFKDLFNKIMLINFN
jgi:hypothetical protein